VADVSRVSYARRLSDLADADPDRLAVTCGEASLTRRQLDDEATALARDLAARGVTTGAMVTFALPNSVEWFVAAVASWKLGAIPQPVGAHLPLPELAAII
jgi:bile acid-coenzyme A ligase